MIEISPHQTRVTSTCDVNLHDKIVVARSLDTSLVLDVYLAVTSVHIEVSVFVSYLKK